MNLGSIGKSIASVAAKGGLKVKKCSPEILVVAGIGAIIGGGILACRATLKARGIQVERSEKMDLIDETRENNDSDVYSDQDYKNDKRIVNMQTAWAYVKLYGPSVALGVAGTAAILGGHNILKGRNIALVAAYEALQKGYEQYRARVCDELGEEKDFHFRHGTTEAEIITEEVDEDGKKKKVKKVEQQLSADEPSIYARLFEQEERMNGGETWNGSTQFSPVHQYNYAFLTQKQNWFNERLYATGAVFLNEVYEELGFPKTKAGQAVGWLTKGKGGIDGRISFGNSLDLLAYHDGDPILLDFNVDGVIWDKI